MRTPSARERRDEQTRYAVTVLERAALRVPDSCLEDLIEATEAGIGAGPIFDREAWDADQAELKRRTALARATLDYRRRVEAIARGEEA